MSNVPKLRFREFSDEWIKRRVDDVYSFKTTNSFSRDTLNYESGEVFNIHYGDIHTKFLTSFSLSHEEVPYINGEVPLDKIKKDNYCQIGDLVIADASEDYDDIGKAIELIDLDGSDVLAGLHTILARPQKNTFALGFAGRLFQSWTVRKQVMRLSQGAKVLGLSKGYLSEVLLDYPMLAEQQKIAAFLTSVDIKIEQLVQKEALLKQYKKGVMQKVFLQEIRFKADDGSEFPEWEKLSLGDIYKDLKTGSTPSRAKPEYFRGENLWITSGELNYNRISDTAEKISDEAVKDTGLRLYPAGTFFIAITGLEAPGTRGKCGINALPATTNQSCMAFYEKSNVDTSFLYYWYRHFSEGLYFKYAQGTKQQSYNNKIVESFVISLPSNEEQERIALFLSSLGERIDKISEQVRSAQTFKKGLLQHMFV